MCKKHGHGFLKQIACALAMGAAMTSVPATGYAATGYTATRYPIILVPGTSGFDSVVGVDYWFKIGPALRNGGAQVYAAVLSGAHKPEVTGEQLVAQIQYVMAKTGAPKVHIMGHSLGGPTVRYAAGVMPEAVASVTSIAGANGPIRMFELMQKVIDSPGALGTLGKLGVTATNTFMKLLAVLSGKPPLPEDAAAEVRAFTQAGAADFRARFPGGMPPEDCSVKNGPELANGVRYFSWTGNALRTNFLDVSDPILVVLGGVSRLLDGPNDGAVPVCASRLGRQIGVYRQNHVDEINHVLGLTSPFEVSPVTLFREHANRLKVLGL